MEVSYSVIAGSGFPADSQLYYCDSPPAQSPAAMNEESVSMRQRTGNQLFRLANPSN
jgi:hypothetical protein